MKQHFCNSSSRAICTYFFNNKDKNIEMPFFRKRIGKKEICIIK